MRHLSRAVLLALLIVCAFAVPAPKPRNELFRSSSWITYGDGHRPVHSTTDAGKGLDHFVFPHVLRQLNDGHVTELSVRQVGAAVPGSPPPVESTVIRGSGDKSTFVCTLQNVPSGLDVRAAVEKTLAIVERAWPSSVPVEMRVAFTSLGGKDVLANGGGTYFVNMQDLFDSVLPIAAAEAVRGTTLNANDTPLGRYDVLITMNDKANWYTGIDKNPGNEQYDLVTVLLHEVYHNLMFAGGLTVDVRRDQSSPGGVSQSARYEHRQAARFERDVPTRFDVFLANKDNCQVLGYFKEEALARNLSESRGVPVTTAQLVADAVTNGELFFSHRAFGSIAKLYAPRVFQPKSSIYHFDPATIRKPDALMAPTIRRGDSIDTIGPVILAMQAVFLNKDIKGATVCTGPLLDPTPKQDPTLSDRTIPGPHTTDPKGGAVRKIGGLRVWVFGLIVGLSALIGLILLGICLFCCFSYFKAKRDAHSTYATSEPEGTYADHVPSVVSGASAGVVTASQLSGSERPSPSNGRTGSEGGSTIGSGNGSGLGAAAGAGAAVGAGAAIAGKSDSQKSDEIDEEESIYSDPCKRKKSSKGDSDGSKEPSKKSSKKNGTGENGSDVRSGSSGYSKSSGKDSSRSGSSGDSGVRKSVCPSSGRNAYECRCKHCQYHNEGRKLPSCVPPSIHTFDPSSVPSVSEERKKSKSESRKSSDKSASKSGKSGKRYCVCPHKSTSRSPSGICDVCSGVELPICGSASSGSGGGSGSSGSAGSSTKPHSKGTSKKSSAGAPVNIVKNYYYYGDKCKPKSECPSSQVPSGNDFDCGVPKRKSKSDKSKSHKSKSDGVPFDYNGGSKKSKSDAGAFDCAELFDCGNATKDATKLGISRKPLPTISSDYYLDQSETTTTADSSHLYPFERVSSHKNPKVPVRVSSKRSTSTAPSSSYCPPSSGASSEAPKRKIPSCKPPVAARHSSKHHSSSVAPSHHHKHPTKHSHKHASTKYTTTMASSTCQCSSSKGTVCKESCIHCCSLDETISSSCCKHPTCKAPSTAPSTVPSSKSSTCKDVTLSASCKKSRKDSSAPESSCKASSCKKKSSDKKSSCHDKESSKKKSSDEKESSKKKSSDDKESSCKKLSCHDKDSSKKKSSDEKGSSSKKSSKYSESCKKSSKHSDKESCKKSSSCKKKSKEGCKEKDSCKKSSSKKDSDKSKPKCPPSCAPYSSTSASSSKHPSSCPPTSSASTPSLTEPSSSAVSSSSSSSGKPASTCPPSCAPPSEKKKCTKHKSAVKLSPLKSPISKHKTSRAYSDLSSSFSSSDGPSTRIRRRSSAKDLKKKPVTTRVTSRHTKTTFTDGKPLEKYSKSKSTTKYRNVPESTSYETSSVSSSTDPTSTYMTSSISLTEPSVKRKKSSKHKHHHKSSELKKSKSHKEISRKHAHTELKRSKSHRELRDHKERKERRERKEEIVPTTMSLSTKHFMSTIAPSTRASQRVEAHSIALDPANKKSHTKVASTKRVKSKKVTSAKAPISEITAADIKSMTTVTKTKLVSRRDAIDTQSTDFTWSDDYSSDISSSVLTSSARSNRQSESTKRAHIPSTKVPTKVPLKVPMALHSRSSKHSKKSCSHKSESSKQVPSSCPPSSSHESESSNSSLQPSSCPPSSTIGKSTSCKSTSVVASSCPPSSSSSSHSSSHKSSSSSKSSSFHPSSCPPSSISDKPETTVKKSSSRKSIKTTTKDGATVVTVTKVEKSQKSQKSKLEKSSSKKDKVPSCKPPVVCHDKSIGKSSSKKCISKSSSKKSCSSTRADSGCPSTKISNSECGNNDTYHTASSKTPSCGSSSSRGDEHVVQMRGHPKGCRCGMCVGTIGTKIQVSVMPYYGKQK